nr:serine--tRNA ligase [Desulfuromonadales bacterium]NIS40649.1 serine--tRNA ligase [Desulfuromonadales bacterium]
MLDSKLLRENIDSVVERLNSRGEEADLSWFGDFDARRRELLGEGESLKAERNKVSALIGKTKDKSTVQDEIARMKDVSARIKGIDEELRQLEDDLKGRMLTIP